ncbi:IGF-like family receptor 1 isoform X2 [Mugil cephalus]|uniref:IGF-like family receptor 1 isoform X2 n=1 Tax=Mugil cephalus TaxID=48193 RepID=UPI001FB62AFC|nr:IGF-like family receptor 1 isoform X2 [Mugil cephalus]
MKEVAPEGYRSWSTTIVRSFLRMVHSDSCSDPLTHWDGRKCISCRRERGHYVTTNCGYDDDGGRHEPALQPCEPDTFNDDDRSAHCRPCASCPPGQYTTRKCNTTTDTICSDARTTTITVPVTEPATSSEATHVFSIASTAQTYFSTSVSVKAASELPSAAVWAAPLTTAVFFVLISLFAYIVVVKRKRGNSDLEDVLDAKILAAPLHTVLDNLDVLEELVILLDPECVGTKNTKHLASRCSFPSSWITYTYSMKESKSPLRAVLEGVTSKHPDWTVGHLAKHLQQMDRNDAVAVLSKLSLNVVEV